MATTRTLMAKGSVWEAHEDFKFLSLSKSKIEQTSSYDDKWKKTVTTNVVSAVYVDVKKGDKFEITDKMSTYYFGHNNHLEGLFVPVTITGSIKAAGWIEFKEISDHLTLTKSVQQLIYVFHSAKRGYISRIPWSSYHDEKDYEAAQKTGGVLYSDKLTKAMKKKRSQDAKQFLLSHSGYYDGIDTSEIYYVFEPGGKKVDFPDDLIIQEVDKVTKAVISESPAQDYLKDAFRLRPLTLKYGGPVRAVFKDMEEKGEKYSTLVMFQDNDDQRYTGDKSEKVEALKAEFKASKPTKGSYIMKSDTRTVAFAFKNRSDALTFRLSYSGDLPSVLVDADTLEEVSK